MKNEMTPSSVVEDIGLALGTVLQKRYELKNYISIGQTSLIYLAYDTICKSEVVVKEFCPYAFANRDLDHMTVVLKREAYKKQYEQMRSAFELECKVLKKLSMTRKKKSHIVTYFDSFHENETVYLVMEYIDGYDLEDAIRDGEKIPYKKSIRHIIKMVDDIHKAGILHLDLKPSNILINKKQEFVLIDFGSARFANQPSTAVSFATKGYSAPELFTNGAVSVKSDIYSVGAMIYYFTTGRVPESAKERLQEDSLKTLSSYRKVPGILEHFVMKCLSMSEERRPKSLKLLYYLFL